MSDIQPLMLTAVAGRVSSRSVKRWHRIRGRLAIQQTWLSLTRLLNSCIFSSWVRILTCPHIFPAAELHCGLWQQAVVVDGGGCSITRGKRGFMALSHGHLPKSPFMMWASGARVLTARRVSVFWEQQLNFISIFFYFLDESMSRLSCKDVRKWWKTPRWRPRMLCFVTNTDISN